MSTLDVQQRDEASPPPLRRNASGEVEQSSLLDTIAWFIARDPHVAVIRHPHVEELFRWRQASTPEEAASFSFDSAEDRLAIGIFQAASVNDAEEELHAWISGLLTALNDARQTVEGMTESYGLDVSAEVSALQRAEKLPGAAERDVFLTACWLEVLCTAEARVLGWAYQNLYGRPYNPGNF